MKRNILAALLCLVLLSGCVAPAETSSTLTTQTTQSTASTTGTTQTPPTRPSEPIDLHEAVYLGVEGYHSLSMQDKANFIHLFFQDGQIIKLRLQEDAAYTLQNQLMEGSIYLLKTENGCLTGLELQIPSPTPLNSERTVYQITSAPGGAQVTATQLSAGQTVCAIGKNHYLLPEYTSYMPPVSGTPGLKTLKNLLATAMMPVGTTLYVYGGGWDWQDVGASQQATTIGLPQSWVQFFQNQTASYHYDSYFPRGGWNQYYYAGADCSGYLGWAVYNTLHDHSGQPGYVGSSTQMAAKFAQNGWGSLVSDQMLPGDILSMKSHVYLSLGTCSDGSILILHSTPNTTGGAGVQLSAIGSSRACEAWQLADHYMNTYFPEWAARYGQQVLCLSPSAYAPTAHFRWSLLSDPDGLQSRTPKQVLEALFGA